MKNMRFYKCNKCGNILVSINEKNDNVICCGETMTLLKSRSVDAAVEKHVPTYQIYGGKIMVKVNHVMEEDHYIEWIAYVYENRERIKYLTPGEEAEVTFKYKPGAALYAYCNKHGLWKCDVE